MNEVKNKNWSFSALFMNLKEGNNTHISNNQYKVTITFIGNSSKNNYPLTVYRQTYSNKHDRCLIDDPTLFWEPFNIIMIQKESEKGGYLVVDKYTGQICWVCKTKEQAKNHNEERLIIIKLKGYEVDR